MNICQDNMRCKENPETRGYSIECSCFDKGKDNYFIAGIGCPNKWKEIDRINEIGSTEKPIETREFPVYKPNCDLTTCRYNSNGKCENEEERKECVEASIKVLCLEENFIGVIENTGQEICGTITKHYIKGSNKEFIRTFNTTRNITDFGVTSKLRLATGEVTEVYKADNFQKLIEF